MQIQNKAGRSYRDVVAGPQIQSSPQLAEATSDIIGNTSVNFILYEDSNAPRASPPQSTDLIPGSQAFLHQIASSGPLLVGSSDDIRTHMTAIAQAQAIAAVLSAYVPADTAALDRSLILTTGYSTNNQSINHNG